jgi:hypothetical protein
MNGGAEQEHQDCVGSTLRHLSRGMQVLLANGSLA